MRYFLKLHKDADKVQRCRFQQFIIAKCFDVDRLPDYAFTCYCELSPKEIVHCAKSDFSVDVKLLSIWFAW